MQKLNIIKVSILLVLVINAILFLVLNGIFIYSLNSVGLKDSGPFIFVAPLFSLGHLISGLLGVMSYYLFKKGKIDDGIIIINAVSSAIFFIFYTAIFVLPFNILIIILSISVKEESKKVPG